MTAKTIAGMVPGVMAAGLLAHSIKAIDFDIKPKKGKKKKNHAKRLVKTGVTTLVAIPIISATARMVSKLP